MVISQHDIKRFERFITFEPNTGCYIWTGYCNKKGYGYFGYNCKEYSKTTTKSHRYSYEAYVGSIPEGMTIDHKCFNTSCVNPNHLRLQTLSQNSANHSIGGMVAIIKSAIRNGHKNGSITGARNLLNISRQTLSKNGKAHSKPVRDLKYNIDYTSKTFCATSLGVTRKYINKHKARFIEVN